MQYPTMIQKMILICILINNSLVFAQKIAEEDREIKFPSGDEDPPVVTTQYDDKVLLSKLKSKFCKKYNGSYISHYGVIYYVEKCSRRPLEDGETQFEITRKKTKIYPVDAEVIAAIPEGEPRNYANSKKLRKCSQLQGQYVTFSDVDVYWVEKCEKRRFVEWDSYIEHRNTKFDRNHPPILSLSWDEFLALKDGKDMPSPKKNKLEESEYEQQVDVIPIDEACKGVEGKVVSYYSKLYKIEKCRKRFIDPAKYLAEKRFERHRFVELSSEQWISLPEGRPIHDAHKDIDKTKQTQVEL